MPPVPLPADPEAAQTDRLVASAAAPGSPGHYDELRGRTHPVAGAAGAMLAPLWQRFFSAIGDPGWRDLASRRASVQRKLVEDGASYNVHARTEDASRVWPLELLPLLIDAADWAAIEQGVCQRARLLESALADLYGPRLLLEEGLLPSTLVHGHPQYLRPMHGVRPRGGWGLHLVAVDLARGPEGRWWVVGQRTQAPSGLGYLLENRLIIGQQFPEAFRALRVQRIASAFRALLDGLAAASGAGDDARLALLTPGPYNETYFEHVFLARYLGLTLVEASDLTVRDQHLYLKTLQGLERVHVLLRRVDDEWLDPLELRAESTLGVPGLLEAVRAGGVVLANLPGAGVLESPGLTAFWPAVARRLLGEELLLPAATSWWCGESSVWAQQRARLRDYVIVPTFPAGEVTRDFVPVMGASLDARQLKAWQERIDQDPAAYTLMAPVRPSEQPVWRDGRIRLRPVVLRVYALRDARGAWQVLPGGLTRVASADGPSQGGDSPAAPRIGGAAGTDVYMSFQRGSASTDSWVLTDGEVDATTLVPPPLQVSELANPRRTITSRAAENLFWLGRYTERAECTIRLARLSLEDLPAASAPVLGLLHAMLTQNDLIGEEVPSPATGSAQATRVFQRALIRSLGDPKASASIAYNLRALQQCAQALRERLSPDHWSLISDLDSQFRAQLRAAQGARGRESLVDVLEVLGWATTRMSAITGAQTDRMTRDDGWRLLSVGRQVERLDTLANALAMGFEAGLQRDDDGFDLLLALFDSTITYRAQFQARREVPPLLHLLVLDTDNPRSLSWVTRTMRDRLGKLARHDRDWAEAMLARLPSPEDWSLATLCQADSEGRHRALERQLRACSEAAQELSNEIGRRFFAHVAGADRAVWQ